MVSYEVPVTGEALVQTDLPYSNIIFNDKEGVLYSPQTDGKVIAEFSKTFNPSLNKNFAWDNVKVNWTRSAPATPLSGFKTTFFLEGILPDGQVDILGVKIVDVIPSVSTTEDILFRLKSSRAMTSLSKSNVAISTTGTVMVNLPKPWFYYDSVTLNMVCPAGWTRMVPLIFKGPSTAMSPGQIKQVRIPYDADMKNDFSDLRFLNSDGRSYLCMNIDSKVNGSYAICTILVPSIDATPALKTIYMVYGNSSATAITTGFTSEAMTSDEPNIFQTVHVEDNFDNSSIDTAIWTVSAPTAGTTVTESTSLEITLGSGISESNFSTCPIIYTSLPGGDWEAKVKINNTTLQGDTEAGIFIMNTRSNYKQLKYWRNGTDGNHYIQDPSGTNLAVSAISWYLKITYRAGTYYFSYSSVDEDDDYVVLYSTASPGFTPVSVGMYGHHWNANQPQVFWFSDFSLMKALGAECNISDPSIDPITPLEDDTVLIFNLLSDWIRAMMAYLAVTEIRSTEHDTPDIAILDQDLLDLGYNGVDHYAAMRIRTVIEADDTCSVRINSMSYGFEV